MQQSQRQGSIARQEGEKGSLAPLEPGTVLYCSPSNSLGSELRRRSKLEKKAVIGGFKTQEENTDAMPVGLLSDSWKSRRDVLIGLGSTKQHKWGEK